jgi:hypothetical protein
VNSKEEGVDSPVGIVPAFSSETPGKGGEFKGRRGRFTGRNSASNFLGNLDSYLVG